ncbi:MAG: dephospho-CoA kinase [Candidatus Latescibacteria bacterium]|nr:dephospho-CoA kinase [Candidatus Latescibacterota bacterium]
MVVGITGSIGSGKSSLAHLLAQRGAVLVDADRLGHQVLEEPEVCAALVRVFGANIADAQGRVVRRELGKLAFASQEGFEQLNGIVRPFLEKRLWEEIARAQAGAQDPLVIVDAALIFEWGVAERFDLIVVVDAPLDLRRRRAAARQGLSPEEVEKRMAWQLPAEEKAARADVVVHNAGALGELEAAAEKVWEGLRNWQGRRDRGYES